MVQETQRDDAGSEGRSERVRQVVQDCLQRRAAGESLSDESIIDAHPDLMPGLGEELRKLQLIAAAWQEAEQEPSADVDGGTDTRRGLQVRCPHCHTPIGHALGWCSWRMAKPCAKPIARDFITAVGPFAKRHSTVFVVMGLITTAKIRNSPDACMKRA